MADLQQSNINGNIPTAIEIPDAPTITDSQPYWSKIWSFPGREIFCTRFDIPSGSKQNFNIAIEGSSHANEGFYGELTILSRRQGGPNTGPGYRFDKFGGYFEKDFGGNYNLTNQGKDQSAGGEIRFNTAFNHSDPAATSTSGRSIPYNWFILQYEINDRSQTRPHWATLFMNWSDGADTGEVRTYFF